MLSAAVLLHLLFLHETGSRNPLGLPARTDLVYFQPYYTVKDALGFVVVLGGLVSWSLAYPWALGDPENFLEASIEVTPKHIQPE